ncbi:hypothetical protein PIECOFPK_00425 [Mycovorax composti]|jgi:hypothetical protein|uniref:Uncharacterized protein n=1 Tax=Mycovorax composti TaxID=2962693 RepID=A0ABZ2EH43_9BACT
MKKLIVIASVVLFTLIYSDAFSQVRPPLPPHPPHPHKVIHKHHKKIAKAHKHHIKRKVHPPHPHYYSNKYYRTHPQRVVVINLPPIVL